MPPGLKVVNTNDVGISGSGATGVVGTGIAGSGTSGPGGAGIGVAGSGFMGVSGEGDFIGVSGGGNSGPGVFGTSTGIGVSGLGATGVSGTGSTAGVHGSSATTGVVGFSQSDTGVLGIGDHIGVEGDGGPSFGQSGIGVLGVAGPNGDKAGVGVMGDADTNGASFGVVGICANPNGLAVYAQGDCEVLGDLLVGGSKSAAVKLRNGERRVLYCMESPECWFEDFGRARLVRGAARVRLERTFAEVVRTGDYHVFLSPEGLSHGLYVSRRTRDGFEVREQHQGKSTVPFSYRIVARRKDIEAPRFKRVKPPLPFTRPRSAKVRRPGALELPKIPKSVRTPQLEALLKRMQIAKPARTRPRRRRAR
jgi:hypothetical protein